MASDDLIVLQVNSVGLEWPQGVAVANCGCDVLYPVLHQALRTLLGDAVEALPPQCPAGMSARLKACSTLADAIHAAGYNDDIGYNQLMYPEGQSTRNILSWVVSRLAHEQAEAPVSTAAKKGQSASPLFAGLTALADEVATPKPRVALRQHGTARRYRTIAHAGTMATLPRGATKHLAFATALEKNAVLRGAAWRAKALDAATVKGSAAKVGGALRVHACADAAPSGAEAGPAAGAATASRGTAMRLQMFADKEVHRRVSQDAVKTLEEKEQNAKQREAEREAEVSELKAKVSELKEAIAAAKADQSTATAAKVSLEEQREAAQAKLDRVLGSIADVQAEAEERREVFKKVASFGEAKAELLSSIDEHGQALEQMRQHWGAKCAKVSAKKSELQEKIDVAGASAKQELDELKAEYRLLKRTGRQKEDELARITADAESMRSDVDRNQFVRQILDLVRNVRRQQEQIDNIVAEAHEANLQVQMFEERLSVSFKATESLIYKDVKGKDTFPTDAYRRLVDLRTCFDNLLESISTRGELESEKNKLEEKTEKLQTAVTALNTASVMDDIDEIRRENEALLAQMTTH